MRSNKVNVLRKMLGMLLVAPVMLSLSLFAANPVHHWKLDETAGSTYEDTGTIGDANGTCVTSHCPTPSDGQVYGAQYFDAAELDRIDVNNTTNFNWAQDANITIMFWMKSQMAPMSNRVMIGRANTLGILWYIGVDGVTSQGNVRVAVANDKSNPVNNVVDSGNIYVTDDAWHHIALVLTELEVKVYVDGNLDFNLTRSTVSDLNASSDVHFGSLNDSASLSYTGNLDDIKLYATDLNGSTINEHYMDGFKPHLLEVTPVLPNPTHDDTPDYTFSTDKNGTITYGDLVCASDTNLTAVKGNNTITFNTLPDGNYSDCTITVTSTEADSDGNVSDPLQVSEFVVKTTVPVTPVTTDGGGGGCTYNPDSKHFDMVFLLMIALGLFYPVRRRFIK